MIEGIRRHRESSWLATVVVQAGGDGGLDEGSDIGNREMDTFEIYFGDKMDEFGTRLDGGGVGREKNLKDGLWGSGLHSNLHGGGYLFPFNSSGH